MVHMSDDEFEELVQEALDAMPEQFMEDMENVAVVIADEPTEDELNRIDDDGRPAGTWYGEEILGLYSGVPLTERYYDDMDGGSRTSLPSSRGRTSAALPHASQIAEEVRKTVIHEIGHHFGLVTRVSTRWGIRASVLSDAASYAVMRVPPSPRNASPRARARR